MIPKGGLVNEIPKNDIFLQKPLEDLPKSVLLALKDFEFPNKSMINKTTFQLYGSSRLKIQPYYGDLDSICLYQYKNISFNDLCNNVARNLQNVVINNLKKGNFITDIKCGLYQSGEFKEKSIHWSAGEILQGFRSENTPDTNGYYGEYITLVDAIAQNQQNKEEGDVQMTKIDLVIPFNNKYFEITCVYFIYTENYKTLLFPSKFLEYNRIFASLVNDTEKQKKKDRPFKIMKRLFALLRLLNNMVGDKVNTIYDYAKYIVPIIGSNISRVSSIYGDLSTLLTLYETNQPNIDAKFASSSIQDMKDRYNSILDLSTVIQNQTTLNNMFDDLSKLVFSIRLKSKFSIIIKQIEKIQNLLNDILKKELAIYFKSLGTTTENFVDKTIKYCISTKKKYYFPAEFVDLRNLNKKYFI
jgi:hypothetical protein